MENIEQLKLDNAKLTERLNNAAKFFREQKAQIELLTKENEELKRTPREEVISVDKWNTLADERDNLKSALDSLTKENEELKNKIETLEYTSEDDAKNLGKLNECIKELEKEKSDLSAQLEQRTQQVRETINENKQLSTDNTTLKENNVELGATLTKFKTENESIKKQLAIEQGNVASLQKELTDTEKSVERTVKSLEEDKKKISIEFNELTTRHNDLKEKYKDLHTEYDNCIKALNNAEDVIATINTAVNHHAETAAHKPVKENKQHRIGDEHVMGENIGI